jgi:hypothetical protein
VRTAPAIVVFVLSAASAVARVGDSMDELKRHYGRPLDVEGTKKAPIDRCTFQRDQYLIAVNLRDGLSVSEEFTRRDRRDFTLQEVRELLALSGFPGAAWQQVSATTWKQRDRMAVWADRTLAVQSRSSF